MVRPFDVCTALLREAGEEVDVAVAEAKTVELWVARENANVVCVEV